MTSKLYSGSIVDSILRNFLKEFLLKKIFGNPNFIPNKLHGFYCIYVLSIRIRTANTYTYYQYVYAMVTPLLFSIPLLHLKFVYCLTLSFTSFPHPSPENPTHPLCRHVDGVKAKKDRVPTKLKFMMQI